MRRLRVAFPGIHVLSASPGAFVETGIAAGIGRGSSDFALRTAALGSNLVRAFSFPDLGLPDDTSTGGPNHGWAWAGDPTTNPLYANLPQQPSLDASFGAAISGNACKFVREPNAGSVPCGLFLLNFSADLKTRFGANDTFFIQWRQRFDQAMCDGIIWQQADLTPPQTLSAIKQVILAGQDWPGPSYSGTATVNGTFPQLRADTHHAGDVVATTFKMYKVTHLYRSSDASAPALDDYTVQGHNQFQNRVPGAPFCDWQSTADGGGSVVYPFYPPACVGWVPNEWMTFQLCINFGPYNPSYFDATGYGFALPVWENSRVRMWIARENQPSLLVHDINTPIPSDSSPYEQGAKFGKAWFGPYSSYDLNDPFGIYANTQNPPMTTWYAEVIISKAPILDPGVLTLPPGSVGVSPLSTLQSGQVRALGQFTDGTVLTYARSEYGGLTADPKRNRILMLGGGGHTAGFTNDAGAYTGKVPFDVLYPSDTSAQLNDQVNGVGYIPQSLVYAATNHIPANHVFLAGCVVGDKFYMMTDGGYAVAGGSHDMSVYDCLANTWAPIPATRLWYYTATARADPVSGLILIIAPTPSFFSAFFVFDPVANVITQTTVPIPQFALGETETPEMVYHPGMDKFICIGAAATSANTGAFFPAEVHELTFNRANYNASTYTTITTTGAGPTGVPAGTTPEPPTCMAYDPTTGLISGMVAGGKAFNYDAPNRVWATKQLLFEDGTSAGMNQAYSYLARDPVSGCILFMDPPNNVYAYRV